MAVFRILGYCPCVPSGERGTGMDNGIKLESGSDADSALSDGGRINSLCLCQEADRGDNCGKGCLFDSLPVFDTRN